MWLGIDFGTTNSAISFSDGNRVHAFRVDPKMPNLLPSLLYISRNFDEYTGTIARDQYLEKNVNKPSRYEPVEVGVIRLDVGNESGYTEIKQAVVVMVDVLSPGRLFRSVKTGLRTIDYDGSIVFDREYSVEQLIAILLKRLIDIVQPQLPEPVNQIVMGRPVKFSDDKAVDDRAEERIRAAAKLAGIDDVVFMPEPIAAAYAYHRDFDKPTNTFIFDFGGGTLDLTVARLGGDEPEILATEGVLIGGDDFDKRLFEALLPHFGKGATLPGNRPIPEHIWGSLLDWQTVEELKQSESMALIEEAGEPKGSSNPRGMRALHTLITKNLYYKLLREVEKAKVGLSSAESVTLTYQEDVIDIEQTITRQQFERLINNEIHTITKAIEHVIAQSGLSKDEIQFVVNTGGSSQIPIFRNLIASTFSAAQSATKEERNMTGVVQGLGIYGNDLDAADDDLMPLLRRRMIDQLLTAPPPDLRLDKDDDIVYTSGVVGVDISGDIQFLPYHAGKPVPDANPIRIKTGVYSTAAGKVLLGTSHSRYVIPDFKDLNSIMRDRTLTPFYLKLEREKAEGYQFVSRWSVPTNDPLLIVASRWGNARAFQRTLVDRPLRADGQWKLDSRGKPDPPSAFVYAKRTSQLLLVTETGRAMRVNAKDISVRGSTVLKLKSAETVYAINLDIARRVLLVFANGSAEMKHAPDMRIMPKGGGAGDSISKRGRIVGLLPVVDSLIARGVTAKGRVVDLNLENMGMGAFQPVSDLDPTDELVNIWQIPSL